jgi:hypothetical protein
MQLFHQTMEHYKGRFQAIQAGKSHKEGAGGRPTQCHCSAHYTLGGYSQGLVTHPHMQERQGCLGVGTSLIHSLSENASIHDLKFDEVNTIADGFVMHEGESVEDMYRRLTALAVEMRDLEASYQRDRIRHEQSLPMWLNEVHSTSAWPIGLSMN